MSSDTDIAAVLTRLDGAAPDRWLRTYNESLHALNAMSHDADDALQGSAEQVARAATPSVSEEWKLCLLLRALSTRRPSYVARVAAAAAVRAGARLKSEYVKIIDSIDASDVVDVLVKLLRGPAQDGLDDDARAELIRALGQRTGASAASSVIRYLDASADKVRHAAVRYLLERDAREAGEAFVGRIPVEEDPDVLDVLVEALIGWQRRDAVPALKELLDSEWARGDEDVAHTLTRGIDRLT